MATALCADKLQRKTTVTNLNRIAELRRAVKSIDSLSPEQFAKLEKNGVNIEKLVAKAEKATAQNADSIAKEIDDAIKGEAKASGAAAKPAKVLTPDEQALKDLKLADEFEAKGFSAKADQLRREIATKYNFPLQVDEVKEIDKQYAKLEKELERATKYGPQSKVEKLNRDLLALSGGNRADVLKLWIKQNPKKAVFLGLSATALAYLGYKIIDGMAIPSPTPKPGPAPKPIPGGGGGKIKWKNCQDTEMKKGCSGDNVRVLQSYLNNMGYSLDVDAKFGSKTEVMLRKFQKENGLTVTGKVDQATLDKIEEVRTGGTRTTNQTPIPNKSSKEENPTTPEEKGESMKDLPGIKKQQDYGVGDSGTTFEIPPEKKSEKKESLIRKRNNQIEQLVFERLVKRCK